jgi:hypothetical protein
MYEVMKCAGGGQCKKFSKHNFITKSQRNYEQYTGIQATNGEFFMCYITPLYREFRFTH